MTTKHWLALTLCVTAGCSADAAGEGTLMISVAAEESIVDGIAAGDSVENIADGWDVSFDKYAIVVGGIDLHRVGAARASAFSATFAVDLASVPQSGAQLMQIDGLQVGRWDVHYAIGGATEATVRNDTLSSTDFDRMVDEQLTYLIDGVLAQPAGRSCPPPALATPVVDAVSAGENDAGDACFENSAIAFEIGVQADTVFGPCELDGVAGVSIPSGGVQSLALTIHGDHLFFNGFPTGSEGGVMRLVQWLADCDLNVDGTITRDELSRITLSDLSEVDGRFQLTGVGLADGTVLDYVIAQLKTQGHINGEGECRVDGDDHAH